MKINVLLQGSSNPVLRYPCQGELEITEMGFGSVIHAVFRRLDSDGTWHAPVVADKPTFKYNPELAIRLRRDWEAA